MMIAEKEIGLEDFKRKIQGWLAYHECTDCFWYSQDEWKKRRETAVGADSSTLHLVTEGLLMMAAEFCEDEGELIEAFYEYVRSLGWFCDQGYSWSWHFMPMSQFEATIHL